MRPLGFLNPWLYGFSGEGLNDITFGSNPGCNTDGFSAVSGWDPVGLTRLVSLHFRCWLTTGSVGDRSRDARLRIPGAGGSWSVVTVRPHNVSGRSVRHCALQPGIFAFVRHSRERNLKPPLEVSCTMTNPWAIRSFTAAKTVPYCVLY
jgi:hypothetical protein